MFPLQGAQMLQTLEKSLSKSLPASLKVYGTVFHINKGNPFNLKVLVDKWPDFSTVVVRPQEQEMTDDLDHYTNTYHVFSKDLKKCQELLASPQVINWKQHLQIQSSQPGLSEVIHTLAAAGSCQVKHSQNILYMAADTARKLLPSLLDEKSLAPGGGKPKPINEDMFRLASMEVGHASLVNQLWLFGGNERSLRFIERCIRSFPSVCLLDPEGMPASWDLMDQTGELRMAGTLPKYRSQGLISHVIYFQEQALHQLGYPIYSHVDRRNQIMQKMCHTLHYIILPCDWNQWHCVPR